ncbi:hypothetical protein HK099_000252 [Clydaea vesicula]|uniref:Uncharacterized protein n=1 Tax=Clydaea vesicula TaxID=447962 RepID=A0AAD5U5S6_9FUNG|nr:hypothetical protein HK099_000252 [Clydaea vesicula]
MKIIGVILFVTFIVLNDLFKCCISKDGRNKFKKSNPNWQPSLQGSLVPTVVDPLRGESIELTDREQQKKLAAQSGNLQYGRPASGMLEIRPRENKGPRPFSTQGVFLINFSKNYEYGNYVKQRNIEWNGIILALIASIGYAVSNVVQELVIKFEDNIYPAAALFAMGATGSFVSAFVANFTNFGIEDRNSLLNSTSNNKYFIVGYIISVALFYILAPKYIQAFSAVTFSFNLLTSDIFIFLFNKFYMQRSLNNLYLAGFFTVLFGLVIFNFGKVSEVYIDEPSVEYLALEEFDDSIES